MKREIDELVDILSEHGYDMLVNNNIITLLKDGYVKTVPLDNTMKLMEDETFPVPINDIALLLMSNHKTSKEIDNGEYDNLEPMSKEEVRNKLSEFFKNEK